MITLHFVFKKLCAVNHKKLLCSLSSKYKCKFRKLIKKHWFFILSTVFDLNKNICTIHIHIYLDIIINMSLKIVFKIL